MKPNPPIPPSFTAKKSTILASLALPESSYTDLSPKGTVDAALRPLIDRINALDGLVTTSSCAGRVSVFLEGRKQGLHINSTRDGGEDDAEREGQVAVPGGKGMGGRWLFVSHEMVRIAGREGGEERSAMKLFGLSESHKEGKALGLDENVKSMRSVRFQFEPMILHIMSASLHHAQPILAAAINAGFRESGVQSLKNLNDPNAFPMVAIRTAGLALESLIGFMPDNMINEPSQDRIEGEVQSMVSEEYLTLLLKLANERFDMNTERIKRFEEALFQRETELEPAWEDAKTRKERKMAEGLKQQELLRRNQIEGQGNRKSRTNLDRGEDNHTLVGTLPVSR